MSLLFLLLLFLLRLFVGRCLYLQPLCSTLIFYYLLLSDYWPSCYLLFYKEPTLISSSPYPSPAPSFSELKGQLILQVQATHKVGCVECFFFSFLILLHLLTSVFLWRNNCHCMNAVFSVSVFLKGHLMLRLIWKGVNNSGAQIFKLHWLFFF